MSKYAIIDGENVINSIEYDTDPVNPPPGFKHPIIAVKSDVAAPGWTYINGQFISPVFPSPTPEELLAKCKSQAKALLAQSDWAVLPDVGLKNAAAFVTYRGILRGLVIQPQVEPDFPVEPTPVWE